MSRSNDIYRYDIRTKEEFERDIKVSTRKESEIALLFKSFYENKYGKDMIIVNNGCDNTGDFLESDKVNTSADFIMNGKLIEIKLSNNNLDVFRFKISQIHSYIRQKASILMVNGFMEDDVYFTIFSNNMLKDLVREKRPITFKPWGDKLCYELYEKDYKWYLLKQRNK